MKRTCSVSWCDLDAVARNLCSSHYRRARNGHDLNAPWGPTSKRIVKTAKPPCSLDGCETITYATGLCKLHYSRKLNGRDLFARGKYRKPGDKRVNGGYVVVYSPDHPNATATGLVMEHRLVMEAVVGRLLQSWENVHHINGIRTDNRPENLELWATPRPAGQRVADLIAWLIDKALPHPSRKRKPGPRGAGWCSAPKGSDLKIAHSLHGCYHPGDYSDEIAARLPEVLV